MDSKCASCGAFGLGVVKASGFCGHCERQRQSSAAGPRVGDKRTRQDMVAGSSGKSKEDIARLLAEAEKSEVPTLDATGVKKILLSLEKKITKNALLRAKHAGEPARFMESEIELDEELKRVRLLAAAPEHYPFLLGDSAGGTGVLKSLLGLLSHENVDISIDVLQLLEELTDSDNVLVDSEEGNEGGDNSEEDDESSDDEEKRHDAAAQRRRQMRKDRKQQKQAKKKGLYLLLKAFIDDGALELLMGSLLRLESAVASAAAATASSSSSSGAAAVSGAEEESQGIYSCLGLFTNLVESDSTLSLSSSAKAAGITKLNLAARLVRITKSSMASGTTASAAKDLTLPKGYGSSSATSSALFGFLLRKVRAKPQEGADFDSNKGTAAELLSILLSADVDHNALALGKGLYSQKASSSSMAPSRDGSSADSDAVEGMEALLEALNVYRKRTPSSSEEEECAENLFDSCCTALMLPYNQRRFENIEGFELMTKMISLAGFSRYGALKVISYAVADSPLNCARVVDCGGLKEVFPAFMGKGLAHTKKLHGGDAAKDELEHAVSIVSSCAALLPLPGQPLPHHTALPSSSSRHALFEQDGSASSSTAPTAVAKLQLLRFLSKFTEAHHEKIDRLVELRRLAAARVHKASLRRLEEEQEEGLESDEDEDNADDDEELKKGRNARRQLREELRYSARMDAGLFTLQRLDVILARLVSVAVEAVANDKAEHVTHHTGSSTTAKDVPALASYLSLLQDVSFNTRKKLYEAAGDLSAPSSSSSSSSAGAGDDGAAEEDEDPETAAILRSGLPASLSLSLTGIGEVLLEFATRLERDEATSSDGTSAATSSSGAGGATTAGTDTAAAVAAAGSGGVSKELTGARSSMQLQQLRPLIERLTVAAGWTGPGGSSVAPESVDGGKEQ
jgi:beta-catenin-like protein 1